MNLPSVKSVSSVPQNRRLFRLVLLIITSMLSLGALIFPLALRPSDYQLQVGDVATRDIQAPRSLTYESEVLTQKARDDTARQVTPIYQPADPAITRRQIEKLRVSLHFINVVRQDGYATAEQKMMDMSALQDLRLNEEIAAEVLALSDARWEAVQQEALTVLEQVMRRTIREDQLLEAQRSVPTLISFALPEEQASMVSQLVTPFVTANSLYSPDLTEEARQSARNAVAPVPQTYIAGQTIVLRGQVINAQTWEALNQYGLIQSNPSQQTIWAAVALVVVLSGFLMLYFTRRRIAPVEDLRGLLLTSIVFVIFLYSARLLTANHTVVPYLFPLAAFGMTLGSLYSMEVGLIFSLVMSVLAAYGMPSSLDLTLFYILTSFCGILILGKGRRVATFFTSGFGVGLVGSAVIIAYRLPDSITDWIGIATLMGAAFLNGLASSSLTLLFQYLFAQILGRITALQLLDLSRPDHPLLQFILRNAPGTYQHSLQVANLAEQAAEAIGADTLLTRVGAIYHDAGKAANSHFFIENQVPGNLNSHDEMDPALSAATIIRHIHEGVQLARRFHLPPRITDFMREHHGTLVTRYQYARAIEAAGGDPDQVDKELFRYPGPRPQSRETALLMLADGTEALARAEIPQNEEELRAIIKKVISFSEKEGQLDDTSLTLKDLNQITESFISTLRNTYHPRIKYPELGQSKNSPPKLVASDPTVTVPINQNNEEITG